MISGQPSVICPVFEMRTTVFGTFRSTFNSPFVYKDIKKYSFDKLFSKPEKLSTLCISRHSQYLSIYYFHHVSIHLTSAAHMTTNFYKKPIYVSALWLQEKLDQPAYTSHQKPCKTWVRGIILSIAGFLGLL